MCLFIKQGSKVEIATEDIIVYKHLHKKYSKKLDGFCFTAKIRNVPVSGKIKIDTDDKNIFFITTDKEDYQKIFLCQDEFEGNDASDFLGYKYSWSLDNYVTDLKIKFKSKKEEQELITYETTFRRYPVKIGNTYRSKLILQRGPWPNKYCNKVDIGLHSYKKFEDCKNDTRKFSDLSIVECIIPAGSKYVVGIFDGFESIASNKIKYVKIIEHL